VYDEATRPDDSDFYRVVVELASGETVRSSRWTYRERPTVEATADLDGDGGSEIVLRRGSADPSKMPMVLTFDGELWIAPFPEQDVRGWDPMSLEMRWAVRRDAIHSWTAPGEKRNAPTPVSFWTWRLEEGRFLPGAMQTRCVVDGEDFPRQCVEPPEVQEGSGDGPPGDLPALMPAVEETLRDERYHYGLGPAREHYAQLQGDFGEEGGAVLDGQVELVVNRPPLGEEHRVPISAGQSPRLVPQVVVVAGDAPIFVVQRSGGDTSVLELFSFWNGELIEVKPTGSVFLGSGVVDHRGEMTEQRTWVTPEGKMFTAVLLDFETRRHHLWQWHDDLDAETIAPTDLGEACIDWETGDYGRCP
jgi:hypothetical protein